MTTEITRGGVLTNPIFDTVTTVTAPEKWHFFAGRCGVDANRETVGDDYHSQCARIVEILTEELAAVGADWSNVVYQRVHVLDVAAYLAEADDLVRTAYHPHKMAPGTLVEVTGLAKPEFLIEIDITAVT